MSPLLIVGAGPTGLTLACELARHGVAARIVDARAGRSVHSKALGVHARTLEVLEQVGATGALLDSGLRFEGAVLHPAFGPPRPLAAAGLDLDTRYPFVLGVPQSRTEEVLEERLRALGSAVERETECVTVRREAEGVEADLDGPRGRETVRAPWLIACDGAHSTVRRALDVPFRGARLPERFLLADAELRGPVDRERPHAYFAAGGPLLFIPLPGGVVRVIGQLRDDADPDRQASVEDVRRLVAARGPADLEVVSCSWISRFGIHRRMIPRFRLGPVLFAGDAAHIHSPVGGQGMNLGVQDAHDLAWKLAAVLRDGADPHLLDSYDAERRPVAGRTLRGTTWATRVVTLQNAPGRWLRDRALGLLLGRRRVRVAVARNITQVATNYRDSPIVRPGGVGRRARRRPGDFCPDVRIGERSLVELLQEGRHVALRFGDPPGPAPSAVVDAPVPGSDHELLRSLGVRAPVTVVVRPDRYLGAVSPANDRAGLRAYLQGCGYPLDG